MVIFLVFILVIIIEGYATNLKKKTEALVIKDHQVALEEDISAGEIRQASLLNNNIKLFIKEFNKKYKTEYIYKAKLPKETEGKKEKYIEAIEIIYGMENAISQMTYAIKEKASQP